MNLEKMEFADSVKQYEFIEDFDQKMEGLKKSVDALEESKTASPNQVAAARRAMEELQETMRIIKRTI